MKNSNQLQLLNMRRRTAMKAIHKKRIVILFSDDSTLIFARRMQHVLQKSDPSCTIEMVWYAEENALSQRQMNLHLPQGPSRVLSFTGLEDIIQDPKISAIVTSRIYRPISLALKEPAYLWLAKRPCIIGFLGGLDFFPVQGIAHRKNCDGVFLFPKSAMNDGKSSFEGTQNMWQRLDFGHPSVLVPETVTPEDLSLRSDIYFFTQAISPSTKRARLHLLKILIALAKANPARNVFIKLRHLPNENRTHLHVEKFDYPSLAKHLGPLPTNLRFTDKTMEQALETASLGMTCTSTAALDVVRAGLPCMIYLDYVDAYRDKLVEPMRRLFKASNLVAPLEDILALKHQAPDTQWLEDMFCQRDLGNRTYALIEEFQKRAPSNSTLSDVSAYGSK